MVAKLSETVVGHDENVQLFMTKTGMSNNDYVQNVSKGLAHVQVGYAQVGYVQVKFVTFWKKFHK